jgi:hypothetical protein
MTTTRADQLRAAILACRDRHGRITKKAVLAAARRNKRSLLGQQFIWANAIAAEKQRLDRAGELIRQYITITVVNRNVKFTSVAYVRDPQLPAHVEGYVNLQDVERRDAEKIMLTELSACEANVVRARAIVGVLDAKFPGLSDKLENLLELLLAAKSQLNNRRAA